MEQKYGLKKIYQLTQERTRELEVAEKERRYQELSVQFKIQLDRKLALIKEKNLSQIEQFDVDRLENIILKLKKLNFEPTSMHQRRLFFELEQFAIRRPFLQKYHDIIQQLKSEFNRQIQHNSFSHIILLSMLSILVNQKIECEWQTVRSQSPTELKSDHYSVIGGIIDCIQHKPADILYKLIQRNKNTKETISRYLARLAKMNVKRIRKSVKEVSEKSLVSSVVKLCQKKEKKETNWSRTKIRVGMREKSSWCAIKTKVYDCNRVEQDQEEILQRQHKSQGRLYKRRYLPILFQNK